VIVTTTKTVIRGKNMVTLLMPEEQYYKVRNNFAAKSNTPKLPRLIIPESCKPSSLDQLFYMLIWPI